MKHKKKHKKNPIGDADSIGLKMTWTDEVIMIKYAF